MGKMKKGRRKEENGRKEKTKKKREREREREREDLKVEDDLRVCFSFEEYISIFIFTFIHNRQNGHDFPH
jgi:hypothetical protein